MGVIAPSRLIHGRPHRRIARTFATTAYRNELLDAENLANARLIAAAPDMFEALVQARDWLRGWASAEQQLAVIDAALATATPTGEASDV